MKTNVSYVMVLAGATLLACGGSSSSNNPSPDGGTMTATDAGPDVVTPVHDAGVADSASSSDASDSGMDHGMPSTTYPAFLPSVGQLQANKGVVMPNPVVVPITWHSDPSEAMFQSFVDTIGATPYWHATTSEYGVSAATSGTHVSMMTAAPASMADGDFQTLVQTNAVSGGAWPAATTNTIYAFFLDPTTSLNMGPGQDGGPTDACSSGVGGYHSSTTVGSISTTYAIVPSCTFGGSNTAAQQSTMSMSHELIEAVTDPYTDTMMNPTGYYGFDQEHFAYDWWQEFSSETGDACEGYKDSFYEEKETTPAPFDFWVQRTWSNKAGPLGHDPCVPAPSSAYFNVAILNLDEVTITLPAQLTGTTTQNIQVKGKHIPVGQSGVVELGFFSDAATSGPWTLSWKQGSPFNPNPANYLNVTIDKTSGQNGEKAYATVTPTSEGKLAGELLWFVSTLNGVNHVMPMVISSYVSD